MSERRIRFVGGPADGRVEEIAPAPLISKDPPPEPTPGSVTYLWTGEVDDDGAQLWALEDDPRVVARQHRLEAFRDVLRAAAPPPSSDLEVGG